MTDGQDLSLPEIEGELVSAEDRMRILSAARLKLTLTVFIAAILLGLSGLMFSGVDRIFNWLTPSIRNDLEHKARHGALELSQSAQLGLVTEDEEAIADVVAEYDTDSDVTGLLVVTHEDGRVLYTKDGITKQHFGSLLAQTQGEVHDLGTQYGAWMVSQIEGAPVGSVAVLVSKARLDAGEQLRSEVLQLAALGCLAALAAGLLFVSMYIGPILRVTGQTFERLERTTEAALAAARLKSEFLANMSHEIRTPMNGIIGVLDLLNRTPLGAKQKRYTQTIESSARGLLTIINDILDFSKLEAGKYDVRRDDFEVTQLVQEATELLSPKAHGKGLDIVVRTAADVPERVCGDSDRIKQIIINLLGNAIKFTEQGHIELRLSVQERSGSDMLLHFTIMDTGVGIRPEDQARLFGVFSQVDGSLTRKHGGTGLGLAISKRIAEAMGGTCGVESKVGEGSTFWFTARVGKSESSAEPARNSLCGVELNVLLATSSEAQQAALAELVERWGMHIDVARSAEQACELVVGQMQPYTVAIVDGGLDPGAPDAPDPSDLCVAEGVPVIRLLSTTEVAGESAARGTQAFLWKPVRASELYNSIISVSTGKELSLRQREQEVARVDDVAAQGRVLVVDDNEVNRLVAGELLSELGCDFDTASNGQEAFDKVKAEDYDMVLMDCQMPEVDGFAATAMIRGLGTDKARIPIIALTAHAMAGDRDRVLRGGMDDYAAKPIRARALAALLRRWLPSAVPQLGSVAPPPVDSVNARSEAGADSPDPARAAGAPNAARSAETPNEAHGAETSASAELLDPTLPRSKRVVQLFLESVPELVTALGVAVAAADAPKVKQLSHKLKGNCLSLGANRMAAVCQAVEVAAAAGRIDEAAHTRIAPELAAVKPLLTQLLNTEPSNDTKAVSA